MEVGEFIHISLSNLLTAMLSFFSFSFNIMMCISVSGYRIPEEIGKNGMLYGPAPETQLIASVVAFRIN